MSIWQNWWLKLSNPADNVVAAVVVLAGVFVTAIVTLMVSSTNRRHERRKEVRERVYSTRAATYVEASSFLREVSGMDVSEPATPDVALKLYDLTARLDIYGTPKAANQFYEAAVTTATWRSELNSVGKEGSKKSEKESEDLRREFSRSARTDIQGLRSYPRLSWLWKQVRHLFGWLWKQVRHLFGWLWKQVRPLSGWLWKQVRRLIGCLCKRTSRR